ncbi:MAG: ATP-dependent DNA helicase RecG [Patescibacteria group bacterium]
MNTITLQSSIRDLPGVGEKTFEKISHLGLATVYDLLYYFPYRWEDFSRVEPIGKLQSNQTVTVIGLVAAVSKRRLRGRKVLVEIALRDDTGVVRLIWFNQGYRAGAYSEGDKLVVRGKVSISPRGFQMMHPMCEKIASDLDIHNGDIVPIYSVTQGVNTTLLSKLVKGVISKANDIQDDLPEVVRKEEGLAPLSRAIRDIHVPKDLVSLEDAKVRLAFDEMLMIHLRLLLNKKNNQEKQAPHISFDLAVMKHFLSHLPYELTPDQKKVTWQIMQDIGSTTPMNRLVEGDVGSGKTVVVASVMAMVSHSGYQTALMVPTEILARQHFKNIVAMFGESDLSIGLCVGKECLVWDNKNGVTQSSRKEFVAKLGSGEIGIVTGTHTLFSDDVVYSKLGLVCVDEQHRFGVNQRLRLKEKTKNMGEEYSPHFLSLTATPIPRTLALSLYGDLDISMIKSRPASRKTIISIFITQTKRKDAYKLVSGQIDSGSQVFVVCPLVQEIEGESEAIDERKAVLSEVQKLTQLFPDYEVCAIHGKMKKEEQESVMQEFRDGKTKILVASSVIEVGIDIPNATVIMIENAERFGLSQLHQLRGRVGRGEKQSYCLVSSGTTDPDANERLEMFVKISDGFELAEYDLQNRGPGEFWGYEQSGFAKLKIAKLSDHELIIRTRSAAKKTLDIGLAKFPGLVQRLEYYQGTEHFE